MYYLITRGCYSGYSIVAMAKAAATLTKAEIEAYTSEYWKDWTCKRDDHGNAGLVQRLKAAGFTGKMEYLEEIPPNPNGASRAGYWNVDEEEIMEWFWTTKLPDIEFLEFSELWMEE